MTKKNKVKSKSRQKKFWSALALAMLLFSGGSFVAPLVGAQGDMTLHDNLKAIGNDPVGLINAQNLALPENFDYIQELNQEFIRDSDIEASLLGQVELKDAIGNGDFDSWKKVVTDMGGVVGSLSEDEFNTLVKLHSSEDTEDIW